MKNKLFVGLLAVIILFAFPKLGFVADDPGVNIMPVDSKGMFVEKSMLAPQRDAKVNEEDYIKGQFFVKSPVQ